jgi:dTDP-4-dehydrorhamnose reductase
MSSPRVWITGAGGLIGAEMVRGASAGVEVVALTRALLDLTDFAAVERRYREDRPAAVVHCAGLTRSPACQADPDLAWRLNRDVVGFLAGLCAPGTLISFSSDLVFDGRKGGYVETDTPNPLSVYAETKVAGEAAVLSVPGHVVVRTSLNYGHSAAGNRAFNEEMVQAALRGARFRLFTDEFRCPIAAPETARAVWGLVRGVLGRGAGGGPAPSGIYHVAGAERLSRWDLGNLLAEVHPELVGRLDAGELREYQGAPRPADTSMVCTRVEPWLEQPLPAFSRWLRQAHGRG